MSIQATDEVTKEMDQKFDSSWHQKSFFGHFKKKMFSYLYSFRSFLIRNFVCLGFEKPSVADFFWTFGDVVLWSYQPLRALCVKGSNPAQNKQVWFSENLGTFFFIQAEAIFFRLISLQCSALGHSANAAAAFKGVLWRKLNK